MDDEFSSVPIDSEFLVLPDDYGIRPAGAPDECFYCRRKVGAPHTTECVMIERKVRVRYSFEVELNIPYHWSPMRFELHRNESSWCASNAIRELASLYENNDSCPCSGFDAEFLGETNGRQIRGERD